MLSGHELGFDGLHANSAEFTKLACAAAANKADDDPDNYDTGGYVYYPDASMITPWVWAFGGEITNATGDGYDFTGQAVLDAAVVLKDLYDNECTIYTPSYPNPEFTARQTLFTSGSTVGLSVPTGCNGRLWQRRRIGLHSAPGIGWNASIKCLGSDGRYHRNQPGTRLCQLIVCTMAELT